MKKIKNAFLAFFYSFDVFYFQKITQITCPASSNIGNVIDNGI